MEKFDDKDVNQGIQGNTKRKRNGLMEIGLGLGSRNTDSNQNLDADLDDILDSANFCKESKNDLAKDDVDGEAIDSELNKMINEGELNKNELNSHRMLGKDLGSRKDQGLDAIKPSHQRNESDCV